MAKIDLTPRQILEYILTGLNNGRIQQVIELVEDVLKQLPEDKEKEYEDGAE